MKHSSLGLFWLFASNLYLTRIVAYSPVYFAFGILVGCLTWCLASGTIKVTHKGVTIFIMLQFIALLQFPLVEINIFINLVMTLSSSFLIVLFFNRSTVSKSTLGYIFIAISLLFLLDGVWRILNPYTAHAAEWAEKDILFYQFKYSSFMYGDSNFVGLQALALFCLHRFMNLKIGHVNRLIYPLLVLSILLTFSRASILSMILCELCYLYLRFEKGWARNVFRSLLWIFSIFFIYWMISKLSSDASLASKFNLISVFIESVPSMDFMALLLGFGFGNSVNFMGIGAHNFFLVAFFEGGGMFFSLFLLFILYLVITLRVSSTILVLPILINFLSLGTIAAPYIMAYWAIGTMLMSRRLRIF